MICEIVQLRKGDFILGNSRIIIKLPSKFKRTRTTVFSKKAGIMIS
jgi:integrase